MGIGTLLAPGGGATASPTLAFSALAVFSVLTLMAASAVAPDALHPAAWGAEEPPAFVDSVTFAKQPDPTVATDNLILGDIDMYYESILHEEAQRVRSAGHDVYESAGGIKYSIYVNPVDDTTNGFNPFSLRDVRFALNFMIDRDRIVNDLLGSGTVMLSALSPTHPDYFLVHRDLASLGFEYDLAKANRLITEALRSAGASKSSSGVWQHGGQPIDVKIFIRDDDRVRHQIGEGLAADLEVLGFEVKRAYGDLRDAYSTVYATDPADQGWHLYTEAYTSSGVIKYDNAILAIFYASWPGNLPGGGDEHYWNYENEVLDFLTAYLYLELYDSLEDRARLVSEANRLGVLDSVRVFIANSFTVQPVRGGITGVVNSAYDGITSKYTPINAQLPGNDTSLSIGVRHVAQSSWNPVGGFTDSYSGDVWSLIYDIPFVRHPSGTGLLDGRNALLSVATGGPDGTLAVPPDAITWNPHEMAWVPTNSTEAVSRVTVDLRLADWHHGQPMDINDILYPLVFDVEHHVMHGDEAILESDQHAPRQSNPDLVAVRIIDHDTVEIYTDYWHFDHDEIAVDSGLWTRVPWELYMAMDMAVHEGRADWTASAARDHSGNWLDMLDRSDANLIRQYLADFRDASNAYHVPYFLYENKNSAYTTARYDAAMSWIDSMGHMVISNGPFYLSDQIVRGTDGAGTSSITRMVLERFDDPTYPFGRGHWGPFADFEPLSGDVLIGSLAPVTGNAYRYGLETRAASELAVSDFNEYLAMRGEMWSLRPVQLDTKTDPAAALSALVTLNQQNITLVNGPVIDVITKNVLDYANANDMVLVSCCSSTPSNAVPGDSLFRLLPDQRKHADAIVRVVTAPSAADVRHVVPVGIDNPWAVELIEATRGGFEARGVSVSETITYSVDGIPAAAASLAQRVTQAVNAQGGDASAVAVLYVGFGEGPLFLKAASAHYALGDVRWFGADQNTASPNVADDPTSAAFAHTVRFTVIQPSVPDDSGLVDYIHEHLKSRGIEPSPYSSYAYDAVWLLGLSILYTQSSESADVWPQIKPTAMQYVGAIGSTELNENGDLLKDDQYQSWLFADGAWSKYDPPPFQSRCR